MTRPRLRYAHTVKGLVLRSRRGVIYVPYEDRGRNSWYAVTLFDPAGVYPRQGYNICVYWNDLECDEQVWDFEQFPYPAQEIADLRTELMAYQNQKAQP